MALLCADHFNPEGKTPGEGVKITLHFKKRVSLLRNKSKITTDVLFFLKHSPRFCLNQAGSTSTFPLRLYCPVGIRGGGQGGESHSAFRRMPDINIFSPPWYNSLPSLLRKAALYSGLLVRQIMHAVLIWFGLVLTLGHKIRRWHAFVGLFFLVFGSSSLCNSIFHLLRAHLSFHWINKY